MKYQQTGEALCPHLGGTTPSSCLSLRPELSATSSQRPSAQPGSLPHLPKCLVLLICVLSPLPCERHQGIKPVFAGPEMFAMPTKGPGT